MPKKKEVECCECCGRAKGTCKCDEMEDEDD